MTAKLTVEERYRKYLGEGWTYIPDPRTWTGGVWYHEDQGTINRQGGPFPTIAAAVEAMDRHYQHLREIIDLND